MYQLGRDEIGRNRWRTFAGVFLIYLAYPVVDLVKSHGVGQKVLGSVLIAGFVALYLLVLPGWRRTRLRTWNPWAAVGMLAIEVGYCLAIGGDGLAFGTYLAVALVMSLPRRVSLPLVLLIAGVTIFVPSHVSAWGMHGEQWSLGGPVLLVAMAMYGVRAKVASDVLLGKAEDEIAVMAAEQERLRIARDLHDLLGHSLTTVTVKAELASRLAFLDPARAAQEMAEVASLARQGLADVRAAVGGYRSVSLVTELAAAREVLMAAGIDAELPPSTESVPGELRELFGWVVREGVTNAVRHSGARRLSVSLSGRSIEVADDGAGCPSVVRGGNGLAGLRERAAVVGGSVSAGGSAGGFRLRVEVPA